MESVKVTIDIPDDIFYSINKNVAELSEDIKKIIAVDMYKSGELSLGKCAKLANLCKSDFIKLLYKSGVSLFNWEKEETLKEINNVNKMFEVLKSESSH